MKSTTIATPLGPFYLRATAQGLSYASFIAPATTGGPRMPGAAGRSAARVATAPPAAAAPFAAAPFAAEPSAADLSGAELHLAEARVQLEGYFAGTQRTFELTFDRGGTPFQNKVWAELSRIPYGETISYRELAGRVGQPHGARAVGAANGKNPLCIIVPCHRVIAADGGLGGYSGGLNVKQNLLGHENSARNLGLGRAELDPARFEFLGREQQELRPFGNDVPIANDPLGIREKLL